MTLNNNTPNDMMGRCTPSTTSGVEALIGLLSVPHQLRHLREQFASLLKNHDRHRELLEQVLRKLAATEQHDQAFARQVETLTVESARMGRALESLSQRQDVLEAASQQQTVMSEEFFERRVIEPLARWCIPIVTLIDEMKPSDAGEHTQDLTLQAVRSQLLELLAAYGIEPCPGSEGRAFDPKRMRPMSDEPTDQANLDRTIARSLRVGWRRGERMLQLECVSVYRFQPELVKHAIRGE